MKVSSLPSVERLRAPSDFELKLVTSWLLPGWMLGMELLGSSRLSRRKPEGVIWSRKSFEVIPKLPSTRSLLKTKGKVPSKAAVVAGVVQEPEAAEQFGGRGVTPTTGLFGLLS